MSIPDVEATQPPRQLVLEPLCYHNWSLNLTTHFHLVLKLRMDRSLSPFLHEPFNSMVLGAKAVNFPWPPLQFHSKGSCRVVFDTYFLLNIWACLSSIIPLLHNTHLSWPPPPKATFMHSQPQSFSNGIKQYKMMIWKDIWSVWNIN